MAPSAPHADETFELLSRFARGDGAAFVEVYRLRAGQVQRWVGRFFKSPFEQEEAAQEIWLTVHRMKTSFDVNRGPLAPWLRVLAANRCRELLRAKGRRLPSEAPTPEHEALDDAQWLDAPGADDPAARARLVQAVAAVRAQLSGEDAVVFEHGLLEERSHEELARQLGVNVRRSKYLKKKLLERLASHSLLGQLAKEYL